MESGLRISCAQSAGELSDLGILSAEPAVDRMLVDFAGHGGRKRVFRIVRGRVINALFIHGPCP